MQNRVDGGAGANTSFWVWRLVSNLKILHREGPDSGQHLGAGHGVRFPGVTTGVRVPD